MQMNWDDADTMDAYNTGQYDAGAGCNPIWLDKGRINENLFFNYFYKKHPIAFVDEVFRDVDGIISAGELKKEIDEMISPYIVTNVGNAVNRLIVAIKIKAYVKELPIDDNKIHFQNGTYYVAEGMFTGEREISPNTIPVSYDPNAKEPVVWLNYLRSVFHETDIPALQEYLGYIFSATNRGQKMLIIVGLRGERKSRITDVINMILKDNMYKDSLSRLTNDRFAVGKIAGKLVMVDDEMELESLNRTRILKTLVTNSGEMGIERKHRDGTSKRVYTRFIGIGNGALSSVHDASDGFYRRQLIIKTLQRPEGRIPDAYLNEKLAEESEGIVKWCIDGLTRLQKNGYIFSISERMKENQRAIQEESNNIISFLEASDFVQFSPEAQTTTNDLIRQYHIWCKQNAEIPQSNTAISKYLRNRQERLKIRYDKNVKDSTGRRVRGYHGIGIV